MCVIEEKAKIFDLIKNILKTSGGEKSIFLYGEADFSRDIKKYITENDMLIFRFISPDLLFGGKNLPEITNSHVDLAVLGEYKNIKNNININDLSSIKSILLNIDNSAGIGLECLDKNIQIITCGLKEKDTVIFSSINLDEGRVILDLQRSVKNINGETVELFEKQINIPENIKNPNNPPTAEDLILSLTALMLCGRL